MQSQCVYWLKRADAPSPTTTTLVMFRWQLNNSKTNKQTTKTQRKQRERESRARSATARAGRTRWNYYSTGTVGLSFFSFFCLSVSLPPSEESKSGIQPTGCLAEERRHKQHKVLAKQSAAGVAAEVGPAPVEEEWLEIALKIEIEKQPTILEVTQSGVLCFLNQERGRDFSKTYFWHHSSVDLLASDGDEEGRWQPGGRGSRGPGRHASCWPGGLGKGRS